MSDDNIPEYSVSELSFALKRTLEDAYGFVRVRGEISGFKRAASGHVYFGLKDAQAVLDAVCWRGQAGRFAFQPEDGLEVVCTGRITTYPGRSKYQIVVETMAPAGAGALMALLEERKRALAAEGLFAAERKRVLPFLPDVVGVVTSPTGAVIRDILHRIEERFPRHVLLWPVLVQGERAAEQVAAAIRGFNALPAGGPVPRPDVLIVARGGGSIEDLWPFNEEIVVRAAAESAIPLVSAVGHETDTTLIDLAADRRAPTPSAAAEMAVPVRAELALSIERLGERQGGATLRLLRQHGQHLIGLARGLPDPRSLIGHAGQRLDDVGERLPQAASGQLERRRARLAELGAHLGTPQARLREAGARLERWSDRLGHHAGSRLAVAEAELRRVGGRLSPDGLSRHITRHDRAPGDLRRRLDAAVQRLIARAEERLAAGGKLLDGLSHEGVLRRGYVLVRDRQGRPLSDVEAARRARLLDLQFADGRLPVRVAENESAPARGRDPESAGEQGRLL